jgi:hypothetical protein
LAQYIVTQSPVKYQWFQVVVAVAILQVLVIVVKKDCLSTVFEASIFTVPFQLLVYKAQSVTQALHIWSICLFRVVKSVGLQIILEAGTTIVVSSCVQV